MPHVSKKELSEKDFKKLYGYFIKTILKSAEKGSAERFFWEFLTPTEKVMFSKRLAIIILLDRGVSPYRIWKMLGVSSSTVERIGRRLDRGGYPSIAASFRKKKKGEKLDNFVEALIDMLAMPPYHVSKEKFIVYKRRGRTL